MKQTKTLTEVIGKVGSTDSLAVGGFSGDELTVSRLKELGLFAGIRVHLVGQAPFGGPIMLRFASTVLALRTEEAQCLLIQTL